MTEKKWTHWAAAVAATCILAGCGGDSDSDADANTAETQGTPAQMVTNHRDATGAAPCTLPGCGGDSDSDAGPTRTEDSASHRAAEGIGEPGRKSSTPVDAFSDKEMVGFAPLDENGLFNSGLKFIIGSLGPQKILDYLQKWKSTTWDSNERRFSDKSIELIQKAYNSPAPLSSEVKEFGESMSSLPYFVSLQALGEEISEEQIEEALLGFIPAELLPEWSIETTTVNVHHGANRVLGQEKKKVPLVHSVDLADAVTGNSGKIGLQQAVDLIHQDLYEDVRGHMTTDPHAAMTKDIHLVRIPDVASFDRLVISPSKGYGSGLDFNAQERATLPVFDEKTQKKMLLTLQPSAAIVYLPQGDTYRAFLKNGRGQWSVHWDTQVTPLSTVNSQGEVTALTLSVIDAVPAP